MCCYYTLYAVNKLAIILLTLIKRLRTHAQKLYCLTVVPRLLYRSTGRTSEVDRKTFDNQTAGFLWYDNGFNVAHFWKYHSWYVLVIYHTQASRDKGFYTPKTSSALCIS